MLFLPFEDLNIFPATNKAKIVDALDQFGAFFSM